MRGADNRTGIRRSLHIMQSQVTSHKGTSSTPFVAAGGVNNLTTSCGTDSITTQFSHASEPKYAFSGQNKYPASVTDTNLSKMRTASERVKFQERCRRFPRIVESASQRRVMTRRKVI